MADRDGDGWPDIEPLPKLPRPPSSPPSPVVPPPLPPASLAPTPPWPTAPTPGSPYPPSGQESNYLPWIITAALAVFVVLLVAVGVAATSDSSGGSEDQATPTTAADADTDAGVVDDEPEPTTTTTAAPTTTTPSNEPPPAPPGFGDGTLIVGPDVQPGVYMSTGGFLCYWERRHSLENDLDGVIVNGVPDGQAIVEIKATDVAFMTEDCGNWVVYAPPPAPVASFGDGDWVVGEQIEPGTYRPDAPTDLCYWERGRDLTHDFETITDNGFTGETTGAVTLRAGERFTSSLCGNWTLA